MTASELARREIKAEEALGVQLMDYAGRWVAIRDHMVVKDATSLDELFECISGHERDIEILRVPEHPGALCCY